MSVSEHAHSAGVGTLTFPVLQAQRVTSVYVVGCLASLLEASLADTLYVTAFHDKTITG